MVLVGDLNGGISYLCTRVILITYGFWFSFVRCWCGGWSNSETVSGGCLNVSKKERIVFYFWLKFGLLNRNNKLLMLKALVLASFLFHPNELRREVMARRVPVVRLSNDYTTCAHHFSLNRRTMQFTEWHADSPGSRISSAPQLCASQSMKHLGAHTCPFLAAAYSCCWISSFLQHPVKWHVSLASCTAAGRLNVCLTFLGSPALSCQVISCYCFREFSTFCTQCLPTREDTSA